MGVNCCCINCRQRVFFLHHFGNHLKIKGKRFVEPLGPSDDKFYPLINGAEAHLPNANITDALWCGSSALDPAKVKGNILVCRYTLFTTESGMDTVDSVHARELGAVGLILASDEKLGSHILNGELCLLPTVIINYKDSETLFGYINSTRNPTASFTTTNTSLGTKPAPIMGCFSSRGPSKLSPGILKV
ncbi:hypothetical protein BVRB_5g112020 [Beta vulgaris subsp. vulgaris]|nr:hypothetical protein BVRB_5g112020 [Beta vulgaris subsp. vulgaris]